MSRLPLRSPRLAMPRRNRNLLPNLNPRIDLNEKFFCIKRRLASSPTRANLRRGWTHTGRTSQPPDYTCSIASIGAWEADLNNLNRRCRIQWVNRRHQAVGCYSRREMLIIYLVSRSALNKALHRHPYYDGAYEDRGINDRSCHGLEFPGREDTDKNAY